MRFKPRSLLVLMLTVFALGCLDEFDPPRINHADLLVVDGFINTTERRVDVTITHTVAIDSDRKNPSEQKAIVNLISSAGESNTLLETAPGRYTLYNFDAEENARYQLQITTADKARYYSDFIEIRRAPLIDKVEWFEIDEGAKVVVTTHDPSGQTRFYRWQIHETWEYTSPLRSDFKLVNKLPVPRNEREGIYRCWQNLPPTKIIVASTQHLANDFVYQFPLQTLLAGSQQLAIRYSMLVRQTAIGADEYEYLKRLQNTTENLGGLFDHQPSRVTGNIHFEGDDSRPVLGYFSGGSVEEKRIFISYDDLPKSLRLRPQPNNCIQDTVCLRYQDGLGLNCSIDIPNLAGTELIVGPIFEGLAVIGFLKTTDECGDCRTQGGSTGKPPYW